MTFKQYKIITDAYLDFYPDKEIDVQINDFDLEKCFDKDSKGEEVTEKDEGCISNTSSLSIFIHYPKLTLINDYGKQYDVYDIYVETLFPNININMGRTTYTKDEVDVGYRHSHIHSGSFSEMSSFCRGNDDTPINTIIKRIRRCQYDNDESFKHDIQSLIIETERMIRIESNAGVPYIEFSAVGRKRSLVPISVIPINHLIYNNGIRSKFMDFIDYYCSLGLDTFYYDGKNWQLKATDAEFIERVSRVALLYKNTKNLHIFCNAIKMNGLYYSKTSSNGYIINPNTEASWTFKGKRPVLKVLDNETHIVFTKILKKELLDILYNYLLNLINGIYANQDKYKDSIHSRAYKIKTALIRECGI